MPKSGVAHRHLLTRTWSTDLLRVVLQHASKRCHEKKKESLFVNVWLCKSHKWDFAGCLYLSFGTGGWFCGAGVAAGAATLPPRLPVRVTHSTVMVGPVKLQVLDCILEP